VTAGRKRSMHACMEDLTTLGLGFLQYIVMVVNPEMYKYRYLGLIERKLEADIGGLKEEFGLIASCNIFLYDLIL
jgi:hypothetical protein